MSKKVAIILIFLVFICFVSCTKEQNLNKETIDKSAQSPVNDYFSVNMDDKNIGTYLPKIFIDSLNETGSYTISMKNIPKDCMTLFAVNKDIVYSNASFHDQFAIRKEYVENFKFDDSNGIKTLDYQNYQYVRIDESADYYSAIQNYVYHFYFDKIQNVNIESRVLKINENDFRISLEVGLFEYDTPPELFLYMAKENYSARFEDNGKYLVLRKMEENSLMTQKESSDVVYKFELLYK